MFQEGDEDIEPDESQDDDEPPMDVKYQRLEKRTKTFSANLRRIGMQRESYNQQLSEQMVTMTKTQHELEDTLTGARQMAEFLANEAKGNADQFRNLDWSRVPAEKVQEVLHRMPPLLPKSRLLMQSLNQIAQQTQHFEQKMTRQAELASRHCR